MKLARLVYVVFAILGIAACSSVYVEEPIGTEIVFYTNQLEALRNGLLAAGYEPGPIALQSWGDRDFRVRDSDGYYVRVSEGAAIPEAR